MSVPRWTPIDQPIERVPVAGSAEALAVMDDATLAFTAVLVASCIAEGLPHDPAAVAALLRECADRLGNSLGLGRTT